MHQSFIPQAYSYCINKIHTVAFAANCNHVVCLPPECFVVYHTINLTPNATATMFNGAVIHSLATNSIWLRFVHSISSLWVQILRPYTYIAWSYIIKIIYI